MYLLFQLSCVDIGLNERKRRLAKAQTASILSSWNVDSAITGVALRLTVAALHLREPVLFSVFEAKAVVGGIKYGAAWVRARVSASQGSRPRIL